MTVLCPETLLLTGGARPRRQSRAGMRGKLTHQQQKWQAGGNGCSYRVRTGYNSSCRRLHSAGDSCPPKHGLSRLLWARAPRRRWARRHRRPRHHVGLLRRRCHCADWEQKSCLPDDDDGVAFSVALLDHDILRMPRRARGARARSSSKSTESGVKDMLLDWRSSSSSAREETTRLERSVLLPAGAATSRSLRTVIPAGSTTTRNTRRRLEPPL